MRDLEVLRKRIKKRNRHAYLKAKVKEYAFNYLRKCLRIKRLPLRKKSNRNYFVSPINLNNRCEIYIDDAIYLSVYDSEKTTPNSECLDMLLIAELPEPIKLKGKFSCGMCTESEVYKKLGDMLEKHLAEVDNWFNEWWKSTTYVVVAKKEDSSSVRLVHADDVKKITDRFSAKGCEVESFPLIESDLEVSKRVSGNLQALDKACCSIDDLSDRIETKISLLEAAIDYRSYALASQFLNEILQVLESDDSVIDDILDIYLSNKKYLVKIDQALLKKLQRDTRNDSFKRTSIKNCRKLSRRPRTVVDVLAKEKNQRKISLFLNPKENEVYQTYKYWNYIKLSEAFLKRGDKKNSLYYCRLGLDHVISEWQNNRKSFQKEDFKKSSVSQSFLDILFKLKKYDFLTDYYKLLIEIGVKSLTLYKYSSDLINKNDSLALNLLAHMDEAHEDYEYLLDEFVSFHISRGEFILAREFLDKMKSKDTKIWSLVCSLREHMHMEWGDEVYDYLSR